MINQGDAPEENLEEKAPTVTEAVPHKTCQTRRETKSSTIVPVYISTLDRPYEEILVYALLDTQSDTTFILEEITNKMEVTPEPARLRLSTMTSTTTIDCKRFSKLQERGISLLIRILLPMTYSRQIIPAHRSHIPTRETANRWPHLKDLKNKIPPD